MKQSAPVIDASEIPQPLLAELGLPLTVVVKVSGNPSPTIKWQIGRRRVRESSKFELKNPKKDVHSLTIRKASSDLNEGVWVVATNDAGEECFKIEVKVSETPSMPNTKQREVPEEIPIAPEERPKREGAMKVRTEKKSTSSLSSLTQKVHDNPNGNPVDRIGGDDDNDDDADLEPYVRRSKKKPSSSGRSSRASVETANSIINNDHVEVKASIKRVTSRKMEEDGGNSNSRMASKPPKSGDSKKSRVSKTDILETDFDSVEAVAEEGEGRTKTAEIVKIDKTNDAKNRSDVKIVIINNDDVDDEDDVEESDEEEEKDDKKEEEEEECDIDDHKKDEPNNNYNDEEEGHDGKLWLLNNRNIIELCQEMLSGYNPEDAVETDQPSETFPEDAEDQKSIVESPKPLPVSKNDEELKEIKIPPKGQPDILSKVDNEKAQKTKPDVKEFPNKRNSPDKSEERPKEVNVISIPLPKKTEKDEKPTADTKKLFGDKNSPEKTSKSKDINEEKIPEPTQKSTDVKQQKLQQDGNRRDESKFNQIPPDNTNVQKQAVGDRHTLPRGDQSIKLNTNRAPREGNALKNNDNDIISNYRPPSRASFKLSQTDNVPIPGRVPIYSGLGKPPPPPPLPGVVENKPLTLTAYVMHKKQGTVNTPRRQKRLDKSRSRSADPLGVDEGADRSERGFDQSKGKSSDNWERSSCTLPGKWSSSSIFEGPGLVPTRSEEYLVIRKSDGKWKSLNSSRDNLSRSFQSLDRWHDTSETGSTGSKIGSTTLGMKYQIITVNTTTEEYVYPKQKDDKGGADGKPNSTKISTGSGKEPAENSTSEKKPSSKVDQNSLPKVRPPVAEKGVGSTTINLKDVGIETDNIPQKADNIPRSEIGVGTDAENPRGVNKSVASDQTDSADNRPKTGFDKNKKIVPAVINQNHPTVIFTPVTPEKEVKDESKMYVSQANCFDFCEVNTFFVDKNSGRTHKFRETTSSHPPKDRPLMKENLFSDTVPSWSKTILGPSSADSPVPPPSPHHYDIHADIAPSKRLDPTLFSEDNHIFARQYHDNIPGQKYVINYRDGTSQARDLNLFGSAPKSDDMQRSSRIPKSMKSLKNKNVPERKRDSSSERVVETSKRRRASLVSPNIANQDNQTASEIDSSFSRDEFISPVPAKETGRTSRESTDHPHSTAYQGIFI